MQSNRNPSNGRKPRPAESSPALAAHLSGKARDSTEVGGLGRAFAAAPFLTACMLDQTNCLLVGFGGQDKLGATFQVTNRFKEIDPEVNIVGFFIAPIAENYAGSFFLLQHQTDAGKLLAFRAELEKRFRDLPVDLPRPTPGAVRRFVVVAPDGPGVLNAVCGELKERKVNIKRLGGLTFVRRTRTGYRTFAKLKFTVEFPADQSPDLTELFATLERFGYGTDGAGEPWKVFEPAAPQS